MTKRTSILIVDDDTVASSALAQTLSLHGHASVQARRADDALGQLDRADAGSTQPIGVVILDQDCAGPGGGLDLIRRLHEDRPNLIPIVISAFRKVESAVRAMRCGAADYLLKPLVEAQLIDAVDRAMQRHVLLADIDTGDAPEPGEQEPQHVESTDAELPIPRTHEPAEGWTPMPLSEAMKEPERRILLAALEANGWNRQETARQLDINRTTLYKKIRQFRLDEPA